MGQNVGQNQNSLYLCYSMATLELSMLHHWIVCVECQFNVKIPLCPLFIRVLRDFLMSIQCIDFVGQMVGYCKKCGTKCGTKCYNYYAIS